MNVGYIAGMPPELTGHVSKLIYLTDRNCGQCGEALWAYDGEPRRQWDIEEAKWIDIQPGQIVECLQCRQRMKFIFSEIEIMRHMRNRADAEPGVDAKGREVKPSIEFLERKERSRKMCEQKKTYIEGLAAKWGFTMGSIYERKALLEDRLAKQSAA